MKEELIEYGLSEKEADTYLACLKTGSVTSNRLSEITGIRRSTVYEVIETLKKKGLVTSCIKEKKMFFSASDPGSLIQRLKEKEELMTAILPDLKKLSQALPEKPKTTLYEGKTSIRAALMEMLEEKEILVYGASRTGDRIFGSYTSNFAKKRVEKQVMMKAVIEPDVPNHMTERDVKKFTRIRTLKAFENHHSVYFIYGRTVIAMSLGEELAAIKINSPLLAESQKQIFHLLWSMAR